MASIQREPSGVIPLRGVSYDSYVEMREASPNRHLHMTYYNGTLEVMSPQYRHEKHSRRIGLVVLAVTAILGIPCEGTGSTTFRRRARLVAQGWGKEPDQSFYLARVAQIRGKDEIDLETDPPLTCGLKSTIAAARRAGCRCMPRFKVPEVWRFNTRQKRLWFGHLQVGAYVEVNRSVALPMLTPALVIEALDLGTDLSESEWDPLLRDWIRVRFRVETRDGFFRALSRRHCPRPTLARSIERCAK